MPWNCRCSTFSNLQPLDILHLDYSLRPCGPFRLDSTQAERGDLFDHPPALTGLELANGHSSALKLKHFRRRLQLAT